MRHYWRRLNRRKCSGLMHSESAFWVFASSTAAASSSVTFLLYRYTAYEIYSRTERYRDRVLLLPITQSLLEKGAC